MDVKLGASLAIEIIATPTNEAARKTLDRICRADAAVRRQIRTRKAKRPSLQSWRRGGRYWEHRMKSRSPVSLEKGQVYTVRTSVPMARDLKSVAAWIKIRPA